MSSLSSFDIIGVVVPKPKIFFIYYIPVSAADDAAAVNPNGVKTLLGDGWIIFFIVGNPVFSNGRRSLWKNPPDCNILDDWVFEFLILTDELFTKDFQRFVY